MENVSQSNIIHLSKQETCLKNNGTNFPAQNEIIFKKQESACGKVHKFNNTDLTSQGSYELYFLNLMNNKSLINEIHQGKSFTYKFFQILGTKFNAKNYQKTFVNLKN